MVLHGEPTIILLLVSLFEHRIEVIGNTGINAKDGTVDGISIVNAIQRQSKAGQFTSRLIRVCLEIQKP